jgi:hypothetical protein
MEIPSVKEGDIIRIGNHYDAPKAQIVHVYSKEDKKTGICGDIEVVYWQNRLKGIKEDAVWNGESWDFKHQGPNGAYVDINQYDLRLQS